MNKKLPYVPFYTGDWLKDPALSICEPATRGIWADLLMAMHELNRSGELRGTADQLARVSRCQTVQFIQAVTDLQNSRAADITERNGVYTVRNRRMFREAQERAANTRRQKMSRGCHTTQDPKDCNDLRDVSRECHANVTDAISSSSSSSVSNGTSNSKEESQSISVAADQPPQTQDDPVVLVFPCSKNGVTWGLRASKLAEYRETYPAMDVLAECRKALQWIRDNPSQEKTPSGYTRFLGGWLARNQNRGGAARVRPDTQQASSEAIANWGKGAK